MTIAFIDHISVSGGIIRYGTQLAVALAKLDQKVRITYFTHEKNYLSNKSLFDECKPFIQVEILKYTKKGLMSNKYVDVLINKVLRSGWSEKLSNEIIEKTNSFDLVYFTTAHVSDYIDVRPPVFATFHDLNWKYLFGNPLFAQKDVAHFETQVRNWLTKAQIIVSTPFVKNEINKFYPEIKKPIDIVFLPSLSKKIEKESDPAVLKQLNLLKPYILYPAHLMPHKNHNNLVNAFWRLNNESHHKNKYILAFSGWGSNHFEYGFATRLGLEKTNETSFNVRGIGYLSNKEIDSVIKSASLIISTSLYEAGSGPGLDAWINGVPFVMSNIESHMDQLSFFGIKCHTFDPMDPKEIYNTLVYALDNLEELKRDSAEASEKLTSYSWRSAAEKYYSIFNSKLHEH